MAENMLKAETSRNYITDAIILAFASISAYYLSFLYEKSFLGYFRIPSQFITLDTTTMLSFGIIIFGLLLFIFPLLNMFVIIISRSKNEYLARLIRPYWIFLLLVIANIFLFGFTKLDFFFTFIGIALVFAFFDFIFPLITQKGRLSYTEKLKAQEELEFSVVNLPKLIGIKYGRDVTVLITLFILGVMISSDAGLAEAMRKKDYLFTTSQPQLIVIRIYSNRIICAQYDEKKMEVLPIITIINLDNNPQELVLRIIGPFHPSSNQIFTYPTSTIIPTP